MISMFLNSRGRVKRLQELFNSIVKTTRDYTNIEVLIRIDEDDVETVNFSRINIYPFEIRYIVGPRPDNLITSYNELASQCKGDYLFVLNDDVDILTQNWDDEVRKVPSNEIWLLSTHDTSIDKTNTVNKDDNNYGSFLIHTKASYEALGYFMDDRVKTLGGDSMLWRLYSAVDRIKWIDVTVDHVYHNTIQKVVRPDQTAFEYRQKLDVDPWTIDIDSEIKRLSSEIERRNK